MFQLILWLSIIWIVPLIYWMLINETKFKKNIVIGVTLPYRARTDEQVVDALDKFKLALRIICPALLVLAIPLWTIKDFYKNFTAWSIWLLLSLILPYIPYVFTNRKLKEIKEMKGWTPDQNRPLVHSPDVKVSNFLSSWRFLPAFILSLLPLVWDRDFLIVYLIFAATVALCCLAYRYLYRKKPERVDEDRQLTEILSNIRILNWSKAWLIIAYSMAIYSLGIFILKYSAPAGIILFVLNTLFLIIAVFRIEIKTRQAQEKLTKSSGLAWYVDDDDYWLGGIIYYNPHDSHLIINNRIGINSTLNLAKPAGKLIMGLTALLLVAMVFAGPLLQLLGSGDIVLQISEDKTLLAAHGLSKYEIPLEEIETIEKYEELPPDMRRVAGTALSTLAKGRWSAPDIGPMRVCLDPTVPPFLLVKSREGGVYLLGTKDAEKTKDIYEQLIVKVSTGPNRSPDPIRFYAFFRKSLFLTSKK